MDRFDRVFWQRLWRLMKPYWTSPLRKKAFWLAAIVIALNIGTIAMNAWFSYVSRDVMNALQVKDAHEFYHLMLLYVGWVILFIPIAAYYPYLSGLLQIDWREWMTERFVKSSLDNHALYHIMSNHSVDNPDQRISQDLNSFTSGALNYSMTVMGSVITAATFFGILWSISSWLAVCLILYSVIGTWLTIVIGRRLVKINFDQQRYEADYRFGLVHARDNAEAIALYGGASDESDQLRSRFAHVVENFILLIGWQRRLAFFTSGFDNAAGLVPYFVLAGAYFSGRFELGEFTQAAYAFSMLQSSLSLIVDNFQSLTDYASVVNRLADFEEKCHLAGDSGPEEVKPRPRIETVEEERLALQNLTLMTPDASRVLHSGVSMDVKENGALLITGPSGIGKTSLMRAVAGLWTCGTGRIIRPPLNQMMFLPQRPYMIIGTLRDQLCYPHAKGTSEEKLLEVLREVRLGDLPERFGGLDVEMNWADVLSVGEQQRLAFARLLLNHPRYAFLDEATSALDTHAEEHLYNRISHMPMTVVSIGHRPSLRKFHSQVMHLGPGPELTPDVGAIDAMPGRR